MHRYMKLIAASLLSALTTSSWAVNEIYVSWYSSQTYLGPAQIVQPSGAQWFGHQVDESAGVAADNLAIVQEVNRHSNAIATEYTPARPNANNGSFPAFSSSLKGIIFITEILMNPDGSLRTAAQINADLTALSTKLGTKKNHVIYMAVDEPVWRYQKWFCSVNYPGSNSCINNGPRPDVVSQVGPALEQFAVTVRTKFPGMGLFYVEAHSMMRSGLQVPANYDLYAYDCYGNFTACRAVSNLKCNTRPGLECQWIVD